MKKLFIILGLGSILALSSCGYTYKNITATGEYNVEKDYLYFTAKIDSPATKLVAASKKVFGSNLKITGLAGRSLNAAKPIQIAELRIKVAK